METQTHQHVHHTTEIHYKCHFDINDNNKWNGDIDLNVFHISQSQKNVNSFTQSAATEH